MIIYIYMIISIYIYDYIYIYIHNKMVDKFNPNRKHHICDDQS